MVHLLQVIFLVKCSADGRIYLAKYLGKFIAVLQVTSRADDMFACDPCHA